MITLATPPCMQCGKRTLVQMTEEQARELGEGPTEVTCRRFFPDWTPENRELLITGTHPECWEEMFGEEE